VDIVCVYRMEQRSAFTEWSRDQQQTTRQTTTRYSFDVNGAGILFQYDLIVSMEVQ